MDIVLDASAAVRAVSGATAADRQLRARLAGDICHAPHLIDAEVGSSLRRHEAAGRLVPNAAAAGLVAMTGLINSRYAHGPLAPAAWALRHNVTFYDALYAALAARLGIPLLTADARLARTSGLPCAVQLV